MRSKRIKLTYYYGDYCDRCREKIVPIARLDELTLYYELEGPAQGEAIIFLNGLTGDHNNWLLQVQSFKDRYRCLSFDWRDTGLSSASPVPNYSLADLAEDVSGLIEALKLGRCHLVGLSMGGAVAQEVALRYPEKVASLTLASSFAVSQNNLELPADQRSTGNLRHARAISRHDTRQQLSQIQVPTLVIAGERDLHTLPEEQWTYAALIPGAEFALIEGAGHLVQVEKAGEFNRRLSAFLVAHKQG
jgi:pimeloyl-ACP methyl ester carboxylesterase